MLVRRRIAIALAVAAGIALRVWVYRTPTGAPDSDEAIVGLMARHILHGEFTVFYWGQPYGGSQEALLAAPVVWAFGSHLLALRIVPVLLSALAALLLWRVGRRTIGEREGVVAGLAFWLWPPYTIVHGTVAFGFYGTNVAYAALILLLVLRAAEEPSPLRVALLGLVVGLAFWQTAQIIPIAVPALVWLVWRRPRALRHAWIGALAAGIGATPWLVWNVQHDWGSVLRHSGPADYVRALRLFVSPLLPMLLGLRAPLTQQPLLPTVLMLVVYALLLAAFVRRAIRTRSERVSLLHLVAAAFPLVWAVSHRVVLQTSVPIYLIVLSPLLAVLVAEFARSRVRAIVVIVACFAVSAVTVHRMNVALTSGKHWWPPASPRSLAPLVAELDRFGITHAYADYWTAYRLDWETRERIIASPNQWLRWRVEDGQVTPVPSRVRYQRYQAEVERARHGFVFLQPPVEPTPIVAALVRNGYRRATVGPYVVWAPPRAGR